MEIFFSSNHLPFDILITVFENSSVEEVDKTNGELETGVTRSNRGGVGEVSGQYLSLPLSRTSRNTGVHVVYK